MSRVGSFGQISKITDCLYLSGSSVLRPDRLRQRGITTVVNATIEEPTMYISGVDCLKIRVEDHPQELLGVYFDIVADKIKITKDKGGRTLVHCVAGVSRSPTLCMAYLIKYERCSLRQAYKTVKASRPIVHPNVGFWKQLIEYEKRILGRNSIRMVQLSNSSFAQVPEVYVEEQTYFHQRKSCDNLPRTSVVSDVIRLPVHTLHATSTTELSDRFQKRYYRRQSSFADPSSVQRTSDRLHNSSISDNHRSPSSLSALALLTSPIKSRVKVDLFQSICGMKSVNDSSSLPSLF
ncbi:dual specificity phosphatase [Trichuris trichiura]|uniref:Dual specificity phosphatase n=1 Tax=Trichuris trichiura TaxID=36087 RepID=A0A077Z4L6_TRITR|nr:dual specificity phosphatase [Trichuris trichiura]